VRQRDGTIADAADTSLASGGAGLRSGVTGSWMRRSDGKLLAFVRLSNGWGDCDPRTAKGRFQ